jgi:hypothetical protein
MRERAIEWIVVELKRKLLAPYEQIDQHPARNQCHIVAGNHKGLPLHDTPFYVTSYLERAETVF